MRASAHRHHATQIDWFLPRCFVEAAGQIEPPVGPVSFDLEFDDDDIMTHLPSTGWCMDLSQQSGAGERFIRLS